MSDQQSKSDRELLREVVQAFEEYAGTAPHPLSVHAAAGLLNPNWLEHHPDRDSEASLRPVAALRAARERAREPDYTSREWVRKIVQEDLDRYFNAMRMAPVTTAGGPRACDGCGHPDHGSWRRCGHDGICECPHPQIKCKAGSVSSPQGGAESQSSRHAGQDSADAAAADGSAAAPTAGAKDLTDPATCRGWPTPGEAERVAAEAVERDGYGCEQQISAVSARAVLARCAEAVRR